MKKLSIGVVLLLVVLSYLVVRNQQQTVVKEEPSPEARSICYIWNTEAGDSASLSMTFTGEGGSVVNGFFNWRPAEKDSKTGAFTGTAGPLDQSSMSRTANLWWEASAEGTTVTEELQVVFGDGSAAHIVVESAERARSLLCTAGVVAAAEEVSARIVPHREAGSLAGLLDGGVQREGIAAHRRRFQSCGGPLTRFFIFFQFGAVGLFGKFLPHVLHHARVGIGKFDVKSRARAERHVALGLLHHIVLCRGNGGKSQKKREEEREGGFELHKFQIVSVLKKRFD